MPRFSVDLSSCASARVAQIWAQGRGLSVPFIRISIGRGGCGCGCGDDDGDNNKTLLEKTWSGSTNSSSSLLTEVKSYVE